MYDVRVTTCGRTSLSECMCEQETIRMNKYHKMIFVRSVTGRAYHFDKVKLFEKFRNCKEWMNSTEMPSYLLRAQLLQHYNYHWSLESIKDSFHILDS